MYTISTTHPHIENRPFSIKNTACFKQHTISTAKQRISAAHSSFYSVFILFLWSLFYYLEQPGYHKSIFYVFRGETSFWNTSLFMNCTTSWRWLHKSHETCRSKYNEYMTFIVLCYSDPVINIDLPNTTRWQHFNWKPCNFFVHLTTVNHS